MQQIMNISNDSDFLMIENKTKNVIETYLNENYPEQMQRERNNAQYDELILGYIEYFNNRQIETVQNILQERKEKGITAAPSSIAFISQDAFSTVWEEVQLIIIDNLKTANVA